MAKKNKHDISITDRLAIPRNTLSKMWILLLYDRLKLTPSEWLTLIEQYRLTVLGTQAVGGKVSFKGNLMVQLEDENMTWKAFLKGCALLQYLKVTITVKLEKDPEKMTFEDKLKGRDNVELTYTVSLDKTGRDYIEEDSL